MKTIGDHLLNFYISYAKALTSAFCLFETDRKDCGAAKYVERTLMLQQIYRSFEREADCQDILHLVRFERIAAIGASLAERLLCPRKRT